MPIAVKGNFLVKLLYKIGLLGPWSDKAHFTFEDIDKLRQLINPQFSDDPPDLGNTRIVFPGKALWGSSVKPHASEFIYLKGSIALANTGLRKKDWPRTLQTNTQHGNQTDHQNKRQSQ